ncbi:MAG TPA: cyclic 2,3-diphosphoglycerate synthase [Thermoleophilia bacterium]|nr:cyclic 2,3-diphosphoglycerate synthase [Thermoleophilia bacterium]
MTTAGRTRVIIMGAAGRDFHNFNTYFRDDEDYEVVAFTATQVPHIDERRYPALLAGRLYPGGIPICPEDDLSALIREYDVDQVVFAYSDVPYDYVMHRCALVNSLGAAFVLLGWKYTALKARKPVISICGVRTGVGKNEVTRRVAEILHAAGRRVAVAEHPMPYGNLVKDKVQRYATPDDLAKHECTIEELEQYEPHVMAGIAVYAGVDHDAVLARAEREADIILWEGGNNDFPFYKPDLAITVADPLRAGDEMSYYPGEVNLRMADVVVVNKVDAALREAVDSVLASVTAVNPGAEIVMAASPVTVEEPQTIVGKRVLVIEEGAALTHGEMEYGAGAVAARQLGAAEFVDPRPFATGEIKATFEKYPGIGRLLPAMGYSEQQLRDLEATINTSGADVVVIGTPMDLRRVIDIKLPAVQVKYDLREIGHPTLREILVERGFIE